MIGPDTAFDLPEEPHSSELTPIISALLHEPLLTEESRPDVYRLARHSEKELPRWFQSNAGWHVKVSEFGRYIRLFKRRASPPRDRCVLAGPGGGPSSPLVLVLLSLIGEQLWRRPVATYGDLQREVIRVCAGESARDALPRFRVVTEAGESKAGADQNRRAFVEALELLRYWHVISTDRPLSAGEHDASNDVVITCDPERLNDFLAVTAISQMPIDLDQPSSHVAVLCQDQQDLPEHASESQHDLQRRHRALRAVLDDAAVALDQDDPVARYLSTSGGRRQALQTAMVAGLNCFVRRNVWLTCDADRATTDLDFPQSQSIRGQAALLIVHWLSANRPESVRTEQCQAVIEQAMSDHSDWARSHRAAGSIQALTKDALVTLVRAGVLARRADSCAEWVPTGAHFYWQIRLSSPERHIAAPAITDDLFTQDGSHD
jgi:uncharacterized protein (TIGR02678 family)